MDKEEQRCVIEYFWTKGWGSKKIHEELITTLGDDVYHLSLVANQHLATEVQKR
jgi:hypothetical protein